MKLEERIVLFSKLGEILENSIKRSELSETFYLAKSKNPWFTLDNIEQSLKNIISQFLDHDKISAFTNGYPKDYFSPVFSKKIGIITAGNLPLVGFQDIIQVILAGHIALVKPSSQDEVLLNFIYNTLFKIDSRISEYLVFQDKLNDVDAFIATGSGNTSRYFEFYFSKRPNIIRKNRNSVAVLSGNESRVQLADLAGDIFSYFGLGCRNVSKLYVPKNYDFKTFFESIEYWNGILLHSKYNNNYDYMKSIYLVNMQEHLDNGFLLLKEDASFSSPISVLYFEYYENLENLNSTLSSNLNEIQVIVTDLELPIETVKLGQSQCPKLEEYADNVDVIEFLKSV
ncbi:MAG: acyl-CoA reductase [Cytophagaceae bacterium]|nr:acyl-CoA reductase [Cytophagaceae bacterium]